MNNSDFKEPFVWIGVNPKGVQKITVEASNEFQEAGSLNIYRKIRSALKEINKILEKAGR